MISVPVIKEMAEVLQSNDIRDLTTVSNKLLEKFKERVSSDSRYDNNEVVVIEELFYMLVHSIRRGPDIVSKYCSVLQDFLCIDHHGELDNILKGIL